MNGFGDWLKRARLDACYSQVALAEMIGVSKATISRWEGGSRTPPKTAVMVLRGLLERPKNGACDG